MRKRIQALVGMMLVCALALSAPALAESISAWINSSEATIYASTGASGTLRAGTSVEVTAVKNGWAQFIYKDHVGYVRTQFLTAKEGVMGYVKKSSYVYKSASEGAQKYGPLEVGTPLMVVGYEGNFYQVTNGKKLAYIPKGALTKEKPSDASVIASKVELVEWSKGNSLVKKGGYAYIYDIQSGLIVHVRRFGGTNHFEMEPVTAEDTAKLLKMSGGSFSWNSRPVILKAGGKLVAAAINTMPQDDYTITDNNFNGHFCVHLPGSKTHGTETENVNHQAAIKKAAAWAAAKAQ